MAMNDVGPPAPCAICGNACGGIAQSREPFGIIRPVLTGGVNIDTAVAVIKMGGVENKEAQARDGASPKFGSPPKEVLVCGDDPGFPKLAHDRAISWQQDAHVVSQLGQCAGKSPGNIRQPAGLDQRRAFRDDKQDAPH